MTHSVPSDAASTPRVMIEQLHEYIDAAHDVLESGDYLALGELDEWVRELCNIITMLPVEEAILYREELQELMESLDLLKAEMLKHKTVLNEQMGGLEHSKKAAKAYQKSHHMGEPPVEEE